MPIKSLGHPELGTLRAHEPAGPGFAGHLCAVSRSSQVTELSALPARAYALTGMATGDLEGRGSADMSGLALSRTPWEPPDRLIVRVAGPSANGRRERHFVRPRWRIGEVTDCGRCGPSAATRPSCRRISAVTAGHPLPAQPACAPEARSGLRRRRTRRPRSGRGRARARPRWAGTRPARYPGSPGGQAAGWPDGPADDAGAGQLGRGSCRGPWSVPRMLVTGADGRSAIWWTSDVGVPLFMIIRLWSLGCC